jgi:hypothetical protein
MVVAGSRRDEHDDDVHYRSRAKATGFLGIEPSLPCKQPQSASVEDGLACSSTRRDLSARDVANRPAP